MKQGLLDLPYMDKDINASSRKKDHIELAFESTVDKSIIDSRFYYEPICAAHPRAHDIRSFSFLGKTCKTPLWVSSMTGGTALAKTINHNLARVSNAFGFGMGLGSCRGLLHSDEYLADFDVRHLLGDDLPLYANLGVAQVEQLLEANNLHLVSDLLQRLKADGLIIHVNPLQEWLQPEGDRFEHPPIDTIKRVIDALPNLSIIVKEVGQGMGYQSLRALFQLPLAAIDFAANGGTNFAKLELLRSDPMKQAIYAKLANVGHSAEEMVSIANHIISELGKDCLCKEVIVSGGISDFLDGYYLINKLSSSAVYGQASAFLKYARGDYQVLHDYVQSQVEGLQLAQNFLKVK
jgi:isopentenyl-diphosphate delta-isomerase